MSWFVVDCETDGPAPGRDLYSMVKLGAILVREPLAEALLKFRDRFGLKVAFE